MFRLILLCFALCASAQTISYTAYSEESQKAAENEAAAGVAKQISATVVSETSVSRGETRVGNKTELTKDMKVQNMVQSNLFLKGLKFETLPKQGKKFVSVASLNLQELTSASRLEMQRIQKNVSEKESAARVALSKESFAEAIRLLEEVEVESRPYQGLVNEIALYVPVDNAMLLQSESSKIRTEILNALRGIILKASDEKMIIETGNPLVFKVLVTRGEKPIAAFPVSVDHNGKRLAEAFTNESGEATFRIPEMLLQKDPYTLNIVAGVNLQYRKEAGLSNVSVEYKLNKPVCKINVQCTEKAAVCGEINQKLTESLGMMVESSSVSPVQVSIDYQEKKTVKKLTSYLVTLSLKKNENDCILTETGVGTNLPEAIQNSISKMNFLKGCATSIQKFCEE